VNEITDDVDLLSLAPRKPDWDLKRDVEKKLKRLDKRTARAIAEMTRERLLEEQKASQTSLAEVVATTSKLNEDDGDDDE
jgi:coiled-coil domain-containing protein 12